MGRVALQIIVAGWLAMSLSSAAEEGKQTLEKVATEFELRRLEVREPIREFEAKYVGQLSALVNRAQSEGDLALVLATKKEINSFQSAERVSTDAFPELQRLRDLYEEHSKKLNAQEALSMATLTKGYQDRLVKLQESLTKDGRFEEAVAVSEVVKAMDSEVVVSAPAIGSQSPPSGSGHALIAHWSFDGNLEDSSGRGHHGTQVGTTGFVKGRGDSEALEISGDGYVQLANHPDFNFQSAFTISVWVKKAKGDWSNTNATLIEKGGATWRLKLEGDGETLQFTLNKSVDFTASSDPGELKENRWQHVACTFDGAIATLYIDGKLISKVGDETPVKMGTSNSEVRIGTSTSYEKRYFRGAIDEVIIFEGALLAEEVAALAE